MAVWFRGRHGSRGGVALPPRENATYERAVEDEGVCSGGGASPNCRFFGFTCGTSPSSGCFLVESNSPPGLLCTTLLTLCELFLSLFFANISPTFPCLSRCVLGWPSLFDVFQNGRRTKAELQDRFDAWTRSCDEAEVASEEKDLAEECKAVF